MQKMENQFASMVIRKTNNNTFPVRITPLTLQNKQFINKIRINHKKLPSQFFYNPHSMPELQIPPIKLQSLQKCVNDKFKANHKNQDIQQQQGATKSIKSMRDYRSQQRSINSQNRQIKVRDIFRDPQELTVTFSRLPINRSKKIKETAQKVYCKRITTEPYEQHNDFFQNQKKQFNKTTRIDNYLQNRKGINIRRNNHPISTLRQIKRQNQ